MYKTISLAITVLLFVGGTALAQETPDRNLYWGDTHLHTSYSPDAYFLENRSADPHTAYNFAKGLPIVHPYSQVRIQIETPLDFLVITDHAEMMGVPFKLFKGDPELSSTESGKRFTKMIEEGKGVEVFEEFIGAINAGTPISDLDSDNVKTSIWSESTAITDRHNEPGKFSTFIGWEWTSTPDGNNLHRVVFIPQDGKTGRKFIPYNSFDSGNPEDLWAWLEKTSADTGATFIAIPHNSNISGGLMFNDVDSSGNPLTARYARTRMKWEPVVEVTQIKGDSETHPALSTTDEFADFETFSHMIDASGTGQSKEDESTLRGDYARSALLRGLEFENKIGANPYKFGMIGSTDSHTGAATAEEDNFWGKVAIDSIPANGPKELTIGIRGWDMSASGLTAVWAEENTRQSIYDAFQRKEVYATSGPRIALRVFGGWDYNNKDAESNDFAQTGYSKGVPMGGDLTSAPEGKAPAFLIHAAKDPKGANLDRIQVVKGWLDKDGSTHEKVFDVALSDGRKDGKTPVGNTVDLKTGKYTNTIGDPEFAAVWSDPEFDPAARAFYYVRVLQIPTPRNSLYDAIALGMDPNDTGYASTIQERAYSSPIWYTP